MAPLTTFIALIKGWHAATVLALTLVFIVVGHFTGDRSAPGVTQLQNAFFALIGIPVMLFALAFLVSALTNRQFGPAQLFPSVLIAMSAFMAVVITGAMLNDPGFRPSVVIPMALVASLMMSGLLAGISFLFPKIWG